MPILNRRTLRQALGKAYLADIYVSQTTGSSAWGSAFVAWDSRLADAGLAGEELYQRAVLRLLTLSAYIQDVRVASFNTGSGAFVSLTLAMTTVISGMDFEVHSLIPPAQKDLAIDETLKRIRVAGWTAINSTSDTVYSLGQEIKDVLEVAVNPYPAGSSSGYTPRWWRYYPDPNAAQLRLDSALPMSSQLAIRAVTVPTLGSADTATVWLPIDDLVLSGAAAHCYWQLSRKAPAQEAAAYKESQKTMAETFVRLSDRFAPGVSARRKTQLAAPW